MSKLLDAIARDGANSEMITDANVDALIGHAGKLETLIGKVVSFLDENALLLEGDPEARGIYKAAKAAIA